MNIWLKILDLLGKILSVWGKKPAPIQVSSEPSSKIPPALDPGQYKAWLMVEVVKKGQPPHGYETIEDNPNTPENERRTYCNVFTRAVAKMFGYRGFETIETDQAGEMTKYMDAHPKTWQKLEGTFEYNIKGQKFNKIGPDYASAVKYAVQGCLVIAAWVNPDYPRVPPTGHVCVIAPENEMVFSNKWGRPVPMAANAGGSNWYGKGLSWAFKEEPALYLFLGA